MALAEGTPTLEANHMRNYTRPDNVFCSLHLLNSFTCCAVQAELQPVGTDHLPIIMEMDFNPERTNTPPRCNFRATIWDKYKEVLEQQLGSIAPPGELTMVDDLKARLELVTYKIQATIDTTVPLSKPSLFTKRWWTTKLDQEKTVVKRLARQAYAKRQEREHPVHAEHHAA
ncbi:hypothetical protein PAXRUDRAFT_28944 [Paxillus rubicundulus Ve08.2h10]|uniref:Endonuclease/exonuclease/phosphatase domain-containing protein n=1 Tax=Paxillus rubicundulus Ve08.2h10 TaxID=930991 RepID=A0A0D0BZV3_9AGAM|nr:hypothetical protein PAXRUDRAFT_28944 [Paxillus rubicundulus Ve08.2h10]